MSRFKPNVLHGRQHTNRRPQSLKPTNCVGAGSSNSTRFFSPMVGQLRAHSLHPLYLAHSTTNQSGGYSGRQCPGTPHSWQTGSCDLILTTNTCRWVQHLCQHVLYFYGPLALWDLCAHLYEHPPTNPTLSHSPPSGLRLWDVPPLP